MSNEHCESPDADVPEEETDELPPPVGGEEEVGEDCEECTDPATATDRHIDRVWVWLDGEINNRNRYPVNDTGLFPTATRRLVEDVFSLHVSDVVILLNGWQSGTTITRVPDFSQIQTQQFQKVDRLHRLFCAAGIAVHFMLFLIPEEAFIDQAAENVRRLIETSELVPRSVHLDIEHWWFNHPGNRRRAHTAVRTGFVDSNWSQRLAMGVGITAAALPRRPEYMTPGLRPPLLYMLDYAIPQMYASVSDYGSSCDTIRTRAQTHVDIYQHYLNAPPSSTLPIVAGQTCVRNRLMDGASVPPPQLPGPCSGCRT